MTNKNAKPKSNDRLMFLIFILVCLIAYNVINLATKAMKNSNSAKVNQANIQNPALSKQLHEPEFLRHRRHRNNPQKQTP